MPLPKQLQKPEKKKRVLANRYRVEKRLGSGNFGTAWLVTDLKCKDEKEKLKVLKEIAVGDLQPDETVDAVHEARLLSKLDHPGIVKFHDSFLEGDFFCIITEYCEGGDLDDKVEEYKKKKSKIPEAQVVEWIIQLLLAVQYMHDRRVLHRDLKSRNIFLRNNRIKIGDFGISRILMGSTDMASTFVGTPYYMSPEVLKHEGYNSKSDVWSVGCLLYELVALQHAFEGESLMGVMYKIVQSDLPKWPSGYSKHLKAVFVRVLERDPATRPSASEALKIPFIAQQMTLIKNTIMDRHHSKEQKDNINLESQQLVSALKGKKHKDVLKQESDESKWKNMTPRERMREKKMQKADEEAERLKIASQQQLQDNAQKYNQIRQSMNPYETHGSPWALNRPARTRTEPRGGFSTFPVHDRPYTAPMGRYQPVEEDDDDDDEDDEDEEQNPYGGRLSQTVIPSRQPWHTGGTLVPERSTLRPATFDERPITPMKNTMVYSREYSTLDFKDGVPDKPELAETYYSQFEDEFERTEEVDDEAGQTLVANSNLGEEEDEEEIEDLMNCMQNALDKSDTVKMQTLADDTEAGAFGPKARDTKIKNLTAEAVRKLGEEQFERAHSYLKKARFGKPGECQAEEKEIMRGLAQIVESPTDCFIVDQLVFLEYQAAMTM
ncbi:Serine/threonine-protein kinase Nek11 [Lamellibrachia satsuma]|nr:Serine/threonine-protein kinase Nek11 [Lamellibrachia satsuma]